MQPFYELHDDELSFVMGGEFGGFGGGGAFGSPYGFGGYGAIGGPFGAGSWAAMSGPAGFGTWSGYGFPGVYY